MNRSHDVVRSAHPSPFALEQVLHGQASAEVARHAVNCEDCRAALSRMEADASAYSQGPHSLPARRATQQADVRWKQRAAAATVSAVVFGLLLVGVALRPPPPPPSASLAVTTPPKPAVQRQGRELLEPRGGAVPTRLRQLSLRGRGVEFGQGTLEGAEGDGLTQPFTLKHTKVDAQVTGFLTAVTVTQTFENPFSRPVEAIYVFPLPDDAAVHDMTLTAGPRVLRAEVRRRADARRAYETAKAEGRRAALLDQERPNVFTQSVANLLPGERVEVTLQYVAPLQWDDGVYTFNFPMVVGPRFVPGATLAGESQGSGTARDTDAVPDASRISPPVARGGRDIELTLRVNAGTVIEDAWSVSHRLSSARPDSARLEVALDPQDTLPNKDFIFRWRVAGPTARAALLAEGGAFALMLNPEASSAASAPTPKEMVFVIDTSCSMSGPPLAAAKRAMTQAMQQMNADDTFMLIDFADRASSFHVAPLPATPEHVRRAVAYLDRLPAAGGTNQLSGIRRALARPEDGKRLRMVLLMTDGFIGNEEEILDATKQLRGGARVFGFGIGSSVNHYLLSRLSTEGRGFYQYLRPDEDAAGAVDRFVRRVRRPIITDVSIDWGGLPVADTMPEAVPDLFDAQPLVVFGRYRAAMSGTVLLRGTRAGQRVTFEVPVTLPEPSGSGTALRLAWARQRIEQLSTSQYRGERAEVVDAITALGLEHHLVTKYTSLVAVEAQRVTTARAVTVTEPTLAVDQTVLVPGRFQTLGGDLGGSAIGDAFGAGGLGLHGVGAGGGGSASSLGGLGTLGTGAGYGRGGHNKLVLSTPSTGEDLHGRLAGAKGGGEGALLRATTDGNAAVTGAALLKGKGLDPWDGEAAVKTPRVGAVTVTGALDSSLILRVVRSHQGAVRTCIERQQLREPTLQHGRVVLALTVRADGTVARVRVVSQSFPGAELPECLTKQAATWRFPPSAGGEVQLTLPFAF